jgi:hypothetical protein
MPKKEEKKAEKRICKGRGANFVKIYSTNVLLDETDSDVRLYFFNEVIDTDEERIAIADGVSILTPQALLLLNEQINAIVQKWEERGITVAVSEERRKLLDAIRG